MEILNSQTLWENYDPTAEPLDATVFKSVEKDGLITKHVYFTGRSLDATKKTRIYGVVCYKNTNPIKQAALLVGDYKKAINLSDLEQLARSGFVAMAIDYAGRGGGDLHTVYPEELNYCNVESAPDIFEVKTTVKETKLYEYAMNCRRAITYLTTQEKIKGVSLVAAGRGVFVGVIAMGVDSRIEYGAVLFGALSCPYPEDDSADEAVDTDDAERLNRHLEYDIRRQSWILGLAPQTYALQIKIPVYVINSANSNFVDIEKVNKTNSRLNHSCRFLTLPNAVDYITDKYFDGLVRWLKGTQTINQQALTATTDANGDYCIRVQTSSSIGKTSVWYCSNSKERAKYWQSAKLTREGSYYLAKLDLYDKENEIIAFCVADREVATSSPLFYDTVKVARPKIVNKNIFSGNGTQTLIRFDPVGRILNVELEQELAEGYLGIVGAKGRAMGTFAICDSTLRKNSSITLGLDICGNIRQDLTVTAVCSFGRSKEERFSQTMQLDGAGRWQRITIERENFRRVDDGKQISDGNKIDLIILSADNEIIVNNIFLV